MNILKMMRGFFFNRINPGPLGLEPAGVGGGGFCTPCCNSFVFEVIRPKFCRGLGCVKIYEDTENESYWLTYDVTMTSFLKSALR